MLFKRLMLLPCCILFNLLVSCRQNEILKNDNLEVRKDSVTFFIAESKSNEIIAEKRREYLTKAFHQASFEKNDSIKNSYLLKIAFQAYRMKYDYLFKKSNREAQVLATKFKDTFNIADTHWNYGLYYTNVEAMDSAYYHYHQAYNYYQVIGHEFNEGKMLYNLSFISKDLKNYVDAEVFLFNAVPIFEKLNKALNLYKCYNLLGIIFNELNEADKSIDYFEIALENLRKVENKGVFKELTLNNIGLVYKSKGNYKKSIENYSKALENKQLKFQDINHYARLKDNLAYSKFLNGDTLNVKQSFYDALKIRDSIKFISGIIISRLHLAEFYAKNLDTTKALVNARMAKKLAKQVNNNRDLLNSYLLLSKIDKSKSDLYFKNYASLNDSLQTEERKIRNKFTRIRFETDEYIEENSVLSLRVYVLIGAGVISILLFLLYYFIRSKRAKNKELIFEREQQKANEEIYSLMLKQHVKKEEGRLKERNRIAEELHDGILGAIYGTRMQMGFLPIKGDDETIDLYKSCLKELHGIEKEIRDVSHELKFEAGASQFNYIVTLESLLENQSAIGNLACKLTFDDCIDWVDVDDVIKIHLYRIIQEALQNIHKYANASKVNIAFTLNEKLLKLTIQDNGVGFDKKINKKGIGLMNMKSRVEKLKGTIEIDSKINEGTEILCLIPIKN